jgi:YVTN family beta-propeller protein
MRFLLAFALPLTVSAGSYVATIEKVSGTVGFYSESGQNEGRVKVGAFPHEAVLSQDGKLLYVSNNGVLWMTEDTMGTNSISVVDVVSKKKLYDIDLGRFHRPHGIALIPKTGQLLVTTERPYGLILVDPEKRKVVRDFDVKGKSPHMVMLSPDGSRAFVSNTDSASVAVIEVATGAVRLIPTGEKPQGGVFSKDGNLLYIATSGANCITIIDIKAFKVNGTIATGKGPGRIALTPDGKTLVYNMQLEPAIGFADVAARKQTAVIPLPGKPLSLTMTNDGRRAFSGLQELDKVVFISVADRKIERTIDTPKSSGPDPVIPLGPQ